MDWMKMYFQTALKAIHPWRQYRRLVGLVAVVCFLITLPTTGLSSSNQILIIQSEDNDFYKYFSEKLLKSLNEYCQNSCSAVIKSNADTTGQLSSGNPTLENYKLTITLGIKAKKSYMASHNQAGHQKVLHALIPEHFSHYDEKLQQFSLVLDQPKLRQLSVINSTFKSLSTIGILFSEKTEWQIEHLEDAANKLGLSLKSFKVNTNSETEIGRSIAEILPQVDVVLMIPDKSLYNRITISEILLTGYLNKTPFIGYSKALAKTGAIASIITPKENIIFDITHTAVKILNNEQKEMLIFPSTYKLTINEQIAESLDINIEPELKTNSSAEVIK